MTTGTKVFLAVFAACIGIMVVYYGMTSPQVQLPPAVNPVLQDVPKATPEVVPPAPPVEAAPVPVTEPAKPVDTAPGLLTQTVQNAIAGQPQDAVRPLSLPESVPPAATPPVSPPEVNPVPANEPHPSPPVANQPVSIKPAASPTEHTIKAGDTMTSIATEWFGDANKWSLIAKENPLADPNRLVIGQKLRLPSKDAKPAPVKEQAAANDSTFTVRSGDTLAKIAREYFGDVAKWTVIYDANRAVIGSDPAALKVGMKLKMPPK